jgi:hypothetical protein
MYKFQESFLDGVVAEEESVIIGDSHRSTGDFQCMEDDESEIGSRMEMT